MKTLIEKSWYQKSGLRLLLLPLAGLFFILSTGRRFAYRWRFLPSVKLAKPTVVVGNISVGGTGKTPFVQALVRALQGKGLKIGILSRGYGGTCRQFPHQVDPKRDTAQWVGDEPMLLSRSLGVPVVIDPKRARGGAFLLSQNDIDVVLTDDGLQHYALARDVEVVIVDGARLFGNGLLLPAGPLRERVGRLKTVDFVVTNGPSEWVADASLTLEPIGFRRVGQASDTLPQPLTYFKGKQVKALAGIGNPERFFAQLAGLGIVAKGLAFPDHHQYRGEDFSDLDETLLMTEKDAVKCEHLGLKDAWYLVIKPVVKPDIAERIFTLINNRRKA